MRIMMMRRVWILGAISATVSGQFSTAWAGPAQRDQAVKEALAEFGKGGYAQTVVILDKLSGSDREDPAVLYWAGISEFKLQRFEGAIHRLAKVVQLDKSAQFTDAPFVLGQSYYATQAFAKAREAFQKAIDRKYKLGTSLYYSGYCSNLINEDDKAMNSFQRILALGAAGSEMRQPAQFQIGELYFKKAMKEKNVEKQKAIYLKDAVPAYEKAIALNESGNLADEARGRISEIDTKFGEESQKTVNGSPIGKQPYALRFSQDFKYDTNIINQADDKLTKVSYTGSPLAKSAVNGKYQFIFGNWWVATPEVNADFTLHFRRTVSDVFSNDAASVTPAIRNRLDHTLGGKRGSGLLEYEYNYSMRDYKMIHDIGAFYSSTHTFIVGEQTEYFSVGTTTLKATIKANTSKSDAQSYYAPGLDIGQSFKLPKLWLVNLGVTLDLQKARDEYYDQRSLKTTTSLTIPGIYQDLTADISFTTQFLDTMHQSDVRGTEKNYSPSLTLSKGLDKKSHFVVGANYAYTRNISADTATYAYSKHVVGVSLAVNY